MYETLRKINCGLANGSTAPILIMVLRLSIIVGGSNNEWLVYGGVTEPAPPGTAAARIQFTKSVSQGEVDIDLVVFARLLQPASI